MNTVRRRRLWLIVIIMVGVSASVALALYALRKNINLFYTPSQIVAGKAPKNRLFRMGGFVQEGSVHRAKKGLQMSFVLVDSKNKITVNYTGLLPDLFREGQGIVTQGRLNSQGVFVAQEVLAKHDANYTPPVLRDQLNPKLIEKLKRQIRHDS